MYKETKKIDGERIFNVKYEKFIKQHQLKNDGRVLLTIYINIDYNIQNQVVKKCGITKDKVGKRI